MPPRRSAIRIGSKDDFIPTVQKRGAAIIEARGASSAASAANAAIDHVHDWVYGTPTETGCRWRSTRPAPTASSEGIFSGYPCTCAGGEYSVVEGLELDDFSRSRIDATVKELTDERAAVRELGLV